MITCFATVGAVRAGPLKVVDIIPLADSSETEQNAEPSLGVNPTDPTQMIASAATAQVNVDKTAVTYPYYASTNGGMHWSNFGSLQSNDKSIAWKQDGSAALTASLNSDGSVSVFSGTIADGSFKKEIIQLNGSLDKPWIRTGPADHIYVGYNDFRPAFVGQTASVLVSANGGAISELFTLDRLGGDATGFNRDAPSIREAVSPDGKTVYAVFTRWIGVPIENSTEGARLHSEVVVVKSTSGGTDGFTALGDLGFGVTVASPVTAETNNPNTNLSLGQQRVAGDVAIAVDPNNANHLLPDLDSRTGFRRAEWQKC